MNVDRVSDKRDPNTESPEEAKQQSLGEQQEPSGEQPELSPEQEDTEASDRTSSEEDFFNSFNDENRYKKIQESFQGLRATNVYIDLRSGGAYFSGSVHARDVVGGNQTIGTTATAKEVAGQVLITDIEKVSSVYVNTCNYTQAQQILSEKHLLILWGASHAGKRTTAIHILRSLLKANNILEIDPTIKKISGFECEEKQLYVIDTLGTEGVDKLNSYVLNSLSRELRKQHSYMVITIDSRARMNPEALGEYRVNWNERPAVETMLEKHLAWYIELYIEDKNIKDEEKKIILADSSALTKEVSVLIRLSNNLLPNEVDRLAELLAKVAISKKVATSADSELTLDSDSELTLEKALADFDGLVDQQVESWFEKHEDITEYAFMIALAVLNKSKYKAVVDASQDLKSIIKSIIKPPSEKVESSNYDTAFNRKRSQRLKEVYASLTDGYENTEHGPSPVELIKLDNPAFQPAVLSHVWYEYDFLRDPLLVWLHDLGSHPNFEVNIRAAAAVGELSKYDFGLVCDKVLRPWAKCKEQQVQRLAALALSIPVFESNLAPQVMKLLHHWSKINNSQLKWTATVAYGGYVGLRFPYTALRDLFEIAQSDDRSLSSAVAESVVSLFNAGEIVPSQYLTVLSSLKRWTEQPKKAIVHQLGLLIFWELMRAKVPGDATRGRWPTLLWLAKENKIYEDVVTCLLQRALNMKLTSQQVLKEIHNWIEIVDDDLRLYKVLGRIIYTLAAKGTKSERNRIVLYLAQWASTGQLKTASDILSVIKEKLNISAFRLVRYGIISPECLIAKCAKLRLYLTRVKNAISNTRGRTMADTYNPIISKERLERWRLFQPSPVAEPGTAIVLCGEGKPLLVIEQGDRGLTKGELLCGKYNLLYKVDISEQSLSFQCNLPCATDAFDFHAEVKLICSVRQPALIVQRQITDVRQLLEPLIIDVMRRTSRNYEVEESGAAERAISRKVEEEVSDVGFKLNRFTVTLSLEQEARERIRRKKTIQEEAELEKTAIQARIEVGALEQQEKMQRSEFEIELKKQRIQFYGPIIESQKWQLLASLLPDCPQDIAVIMETIKQQQQIEKNNKMETLQILLKADALEGTQVVEAAKSLLRDLTGLSEQSKSRANQESGSTETTEPIAGATEDDPDDTSSIPEEFARDEDEEDE